MVICNTTLEEGCAISTGSVDQHRDFKLSFSFSFSFTVRQGLVFAFPFHLFILEAQCLKHESQAIFVF